MAALGDLRQPRGRRDLRRAGRGRADVHHRPGDVGEAAVVDAPPGVRRRQFAGGAVGLDHRRHRLGVGPHSRILGGAGPGAGVLLHRGGDAVARPAPRTRDADGPGDLLDPAVPGSRGGAAAGVGDHHGPARRQRFLHPDGYRGVQGGGHRGHHLPDRQAAGATGVPPSRLEPPARQLHGPHPAFQPGRRGTHLGSRPVDGDGGDARRTDHRRDRVPS